MHPFWIYLIAVVIVIIAWVVAKFIDFILSYLLKVVAKKTKTVLDDILLSAIRVPVIQVAVEFLADDVGMSCQLIQRIKRYFLIRNEWRETGILF